MILYNITFSIEPDIEREWLGYMSKQYIPEVLATGKFIKCTLFRLLGETANSDSTFALQFTAENLGEVQSYLDRFAPGITDSHLARFRHKHVAFMTLLESVDLS